MTAVTPISFAAYAPATLATLAGKIAVFATEDGKLGIEARKINSLSRKTVQRVIDSAGFAKGKAGDVTAVAMPTGLEAEAVLVVKLPKRPTSEEARKAGANLAKALGKADMLVLAGSTYRAEEIAQGIALRNYTYEDHKSGDKTETGAVEVINTDAEGRLVLADVLWYTQERFNPVGMINLATLTGAMLVALGHENAGVFSNSDDLSASFIKAAGAEGEGAWRMPMGPAYDALIKSRIADMKNIGGRMAGSITAAQFLKRFVKDDVPWCHLDIAGTASVKTETAMAPAGATGWGVMALNRLIADKYEG